MYNSIMEQNDLTEQLNTATPAELEYLYTNSIQALRGVQSRDEMLRALQFALPFFFMSVFERISPLQQTELRRLMEYLEDAYGETDLEEVIEFKARFLKS